MMIVTRVEVDPKHTWQRRTAQKPRKRLWKKMFFRFRCPEGQTDLSKQDLARLEGQALIFYDWRE